MSPPVRPQRVKPRNRLSNRRVSDHGVFAVEALRYEDIDRDVFVFSCSDWCNVVAETREGDVLLVWQYRFGTHALSLEIPGGVIDPGEAPEDAARRELREETGYVAESFELLRVVEPNPALQGNRTFTYLARGAHLEGATRFDELEDLELALCPRGRVLGLVDDGTITHSLAIVGLEAYCRKHGPF